ncbi:MAG: response regulator [Hyphomicrobiales bacterium]
MEDSREPAREWRGTGTVLVVDDEETVRLVTARALEHMGFDVMTAGDGQAGVNLFAKHAEQVRCVLLDMTMPQMNGEQAFEAIHALKPGARVVLMSGYNEQEAAEQFAGRDLAGFIQKPFDLATLRDGVRRALGE